ncbi:MAG: toll/interleukin-1 receptor domain-containing protein [Hyphomonadaceae bacterium]|nr:toll/interleukin-1 receptor domain-containing protein [Hyphomonadaceae bacterium]
MTVFVTYASQDQAAAEALEKALERRGQFVELDNGQAAQRPVGAGDVLVLMVSSALLFTPTRLRLEQRALDAWADNRLVVVRLDKGLAPVGLRDLPSIDASFEAQREFTWMKVADAVRDVLRPAAPQHADRARAPSSGPAPARRAPRKRGAGWVTALLLLLAASPGAYAIVAAAAIWLVNRIGPTPGTWRDLVADITDLGVRLGLPAAAALIVFGAAAAVTVTIVLWAAAAAISALFRPRVAASRAPPAGAEAPAQEEASDATFVSYARANQSVVLPVIEAAKQSGHRFWVDQQGGVSAGDGWAGEIVRAIRGAAGVVVMCSKAAFESDHVKREIYLADRYKKRLTPVFIEAAEPPEDFEYFFAGVQALKLHETPESERSQAFMRVLG